LIKERLKGKIIPSVLRAVLTSLILSLTAVLIFAFILKFTNLNNATIKTVNQFVKAVCIFIGCYFSIREEKGLIKGGLAGGVFSFLVCLILGLIYGKLPNIGYFLLEILFGIIIGVISGILSVNVRK